RLLELREGERADVHLDREAAPRGRDEVARRAEDVLVDLRARREVVEDREANDVAAVGDRRAVHVGEAAGVAEPGGQLRERGRGQQQGEQQGERAHGSSPVQGGAMIRCGASTWPASFEGAEGTAKNAPRSTWPPSGADVVVGPVTTVPRRNTVPMKPP